jgi:hypothetical protein
MRGGLGVKQERHEFAKSSSGFGRLTIGPRPSRGCLARGQNLVESLQLITPLAQQVS